MASPKPKLPFQVPDLTALSDLHGIPALGKCAIDTLHERPVAVWKTPGATQTLHWQQGDRNRNRDRVIESATRSCLQGRQEKLERNVQFRSLHYSTGDFASWMKATELVEAVLSSCNPAMRKEHRCCTERRNTKHALSM